MKEAPRPPPVVSRDRQPSYTRPGSSLPSRGKEGSERARRGGEGGPIYEWRKRPARQPSDPWRPSGNIVAAGVQAGKIRGSERPGRWAGGSPLLQGGRQFLPAPLPPVCATGEGPGLEGGAWVSNASLDHFFNQKSRPVK